MTWLTMILFILAFAALAILTGDGGREDRFTDSRRRMRGRQAAGGFPPEGWEVY
ncbi:MAG: hypothetical protein AABZ64_06555 [Nitrospinota bacterium]